MSDEKQDEKRVYMLVMPDGKVMRVTDEMKLAQPTETRAASVLAGKDTLDSRDALMPAAELLDRLTGMATRYMVRAAADDIMDALRSAATQAAERCPCPGCTAAREAKKAEAAKEGN
jgi:ABC-type phosphate/phosphonate transport system substrate-binding protein